MKNIIKKIKSKVFKEFNRKIAVKTTLTVGTMGCVYIFLMWCILPLIFPSVQNVVFYVSSGILQLVLLPLIMVGNNILSERAETRSEQDHKMIMEQFEIAKNMREDANKQRTQILDIVSRLIKLQEQTDNDRQTLMEINKNEYAELLQLKKTHTDIHQLLKSNKKIKKNTILKSKNNKS